MTDQVPDEPHNVPDNELPAAAPPELGDPIVSKKLVAIAVRLLSHDPADDDDEKATAVYARIHTALCSFISINQHDTATHATVNDVRASLRKLDRALTLLKEAWKAADNRTRGLLNQKIGEPPFMTSEPQPPTEATAPADASSRGAYRIAEFRQGAERIAAGVETLKQQFGSAKQDRRVPAEGFDELVASLAEIFTHYTGQQFSRSYNVRDGNNATDFVTGVISTLPEHFRQNSGAIDGAMRRIGKAPSGE